MMSDLLAIIVPMKALHLAKQRLRPAVADAERLHLAQTMLAHVLDAVARSGVAGLPIVVSPDDMVLAIARGRGFEALSETHPGYNQSVTQATRWAVERGAGAVLVLPADLPRLDPGDLRAVAVLGSVDPQAVVIAPDADETGTNALLVRPPLLIPYRFGPDSFVAHCTLAQAAGVEPIIYHAPSLAFDIDVPDDLERLQTEWAATPG